MYYRQILKLTAISLIIRPSNFKFNQKFVYFLQYNNYCLLSPKVFLIHLSLYIAKIGLYNNSWKHQIYKQIKKGEKEKAKKKREVDSGNDTLNKNPHEKGFSPSSWVLEFPSFQLSHSKCLYCTPWPSAPFSIHPLQFLNKTQKS